MRDFLTDAHPLEFIDNCIQLSIALCQNTYLAIKNLSSPVNGVVLKVEEQTRTLNISTVKKDSSISAVCDGFQRIWWSKKILQRSDANKKNNECNFTMMANPW